MDWDQLPEAVVKLAEFCRKPVLRARLYGEIVAPEAWIWYLPEEDAYLVKNASKPLGLPDEFHSDEVFDGRPDHLRILAKRGSDTENTRRIPFIYKLLGLKPGGPLPPVPITSLLVGSALGAAGGYGGGFLLGKLLRWFNPDWDEERLRRSATKIGVLLGLAPGLLYYLFNVGEGKGLVRGLFERGSLATVHPNFAKRGDWMVKVPVPTPTTVKPVIDVTDTSRQIMSDPAADPETKAKMLGILQAASVARNPMSDASPVVSPYDIMRVALGMGSGYASATVLGRLLETYAGAPPTVRKRLEEAGIWAGLMKNVGQMVFS